MESTARAERFDQSAATPSYLWDVTKKPVQVRLPFSLIDRLEGEAVETFRSLNARGSEIGGVLFGRTASGEPASISSTEGIGTATFSHVRRPTLCGAHT